MKDPFCYECGHKFYLDVNSVSFHEPGDKDDADSLSPDQCFMLDMDHTPYNLEQVSYL